MSETARVCSRPETCGKGDAGWCSPECRAKDCPQLDGCSCQFEFGDSDCAMHDDPEEGLDG